MTDLLTPRELAILTVLATHGCTIAAAASLLGMSPQTAKNHLHDAALGVHGLTAAFVRLGWLVVP